MANIGAVTLEGRRVVLVPLAIEHLERLATVGLEPSIWSVTTSNVTSREQMEQYIAAALSDPKAMAFVTMVKNPAGLEAAGSTRYMNVEPAHKRLEIGHTWVIPKWQRTFVNTEAKYLMLRHAFEVLGYNRVEFKTDAINQKSRAALQRIGAAEEGVLRRHMITATGRVRDTVYYSIVKEEWPTVKQQLEQLLVH